MFPVSVPFLSSFCFQHFLIVPLLIFSLYSSTYNLDSVLITHVYLMGSSYHLETGLQSQTAWVQILTLQFTSCAMWNKSLSLSPTSLLECVWE